MIKGFVFDLDGVIVFTDRYHYKAWKSIADDLGIFFNGEINNRLRGVSRLDSLNIILETYEGPELSQMEKEKIAEKKNSIYRSLLQGMTKNDVSDKVRTTLNELHHRGYKLAIGSSSKNAKFILEKVGLLNLFDAISDGTNIIESKPDPEVFLKAAEYLGLAANECAVVEDAYAGIDAAKAGNMIAIGIGDASNYARADYKIDSLDKLLELSF